MARRSRGGQLVLAQVVELAAPLFLELAERYDITALSSSAHLGQFLPRVVGVIAGAGTYQRPHGAPRQQQAQSHAWGYGADRLDTCGHVQLVGPACRRSVRGTGRTAGRRLAEGIVRCTLAQP